MSDKPFEWKDERNRQCILRVRKAPPAYWFDATESDLVRALSSRPDVVQRLAEKCGVSAPPAAHGPELVAEGSADDIRELGWAVGCHNDYFMNGKRYTFWLFTRDGQAVKGEGETDAEALNKVRRQLKGTWV